MFCFFWIKVNMLKLQYAFCLFCGFVFLFHDISLIAQEYPFRRYSVSDGLAQSQGTIIYNDSRGFIWIGTKNGLSRFDGIDFINYSKKDGLQSNLIDNVFEDHSGQLWAVTNGGLSRYTGRGFIFCPPGNCMPGDRPISKVAVSGEAGKIFLLKDWNLILFDNGKYTNMDEKGHPFDTLKIKDICYDDTSRNLLIIDDSGFLWSLLGDKLTGISNGKYNQVYSKNGKVLVAADDSISEYNNGELVPYRLTCKKGLKEVILLQNKEGYRIKYFDGYRIIESALSFRPTDIYLDQQGVIWLPSENDVYRLQSTAFATLEKKSGNPEDVWTLCKDCNNHLWLGTIAGDLYEYDGKEYKKRNEYKKLFPGIQNHAFYRGSRTLSNGETWFSLSKGVLIWDGTSFSRFKGIAQNVQVCFIYEDPDNHKIMIGTDKGLFVVDHGRTSCHSGFNDDDLGVIEGIAKDKSGFYWLSGHKGVHRFDGKTAVKYRDNILPQTWTNNIETDNLGGVWVSSDDGLFCKKFSDTNFSYGLPSGLNKPVGSLKMLNRSTLLVGRGGDICLIDLDKFYRNDKNYFRIYDKSDGFLGDECLDNGIITGTEDSFWILTSTNVVKFYPDRLKKNLLPPKINFIGIYYETDSLTWQPGCKSDFYFGIPPNIRLNRHHNKIKIDYIGISTANAEKVRYISWLEGLDKKWSRPSDRREVIYENLLYGKYCFHLKAFNADGVETSASADLPFTIEPSFYETISFRVISILALILFTAFITRHYLRKSQSKKEEKQRATSELLRLQINSVLKEFDPHFTFNAISSLGSLIMTGRGNDAYSYLTKLSSMLRTVMQDEAIVIKPLKDELEFVKNYLELQKLRFGSRFSYDITIDEGIDLRMEIPKMVIQTFVENSVKHGLEPQKKAGYVKIILNHHEKTNSIIIRDNGIGREASLRIRTNGFGFGLKTVKRIFEIMNQGNRSKASVEIRDLTENGQLEGTEVVIKIPDTFTFKKAATLTDKQLE